MGRAEFDGGVWWIENGALHLDIPMLLKRVGLPDTEENRDLATKVANEEAARLMPGVPQFTITKEVSHDETKWTL